MMDPGAQPHSSLHEDTLSSSPNTTHKWSQKHPVPLLSFHPLHNVLNMSKLTPKPESGLSVACES